MKFNILGYDVEKKNVKNIIIRINLKTGKLYISAPLSLDNYHIERFIISKKKWIESNLKKFNERINNKLYEVIEDGGKFKFLNNYYDLKINITKNNEGIKINDNNILIFTTIYDKERINTLLNTFLYKEAKKIIIPLLEKWLIKMNEKIDKLIIKKIKGKWGYCTPNKRIIAFNTDLVKRSIFEIEYVIIHELSHLKHPNHSKNFYQYIEKYMPNYKEAENLLKQI